jgi:hypothetical protein
LRRDLCRLSGLLVFTVLLAACDPGEPGGADSGAATDDTGGASPDALPEGPWTVVRILDDRTPNEDSTPGADIDSITLEDSSGNTRAVGCTTAVLDPSPVPFPATDAADNDPAGGTLDTADGDPVAGTGYVSLGGATLWCDTGVPIHKGNHIILFEIHRTSGRASAQNDAFSVDLCQTMSGPCLPAPLANDIVVTGPADDYVDITIYPDI